MDTGNLYPGQVDLTTECIAIDSSTITPPITTTDIFSARSSNEVVDIILSSDADLNSDNMQSDSFIVSTIDECTSQNNVSEPEAISYSSPPPHTEYQVTMASSPHQSSGLSTNTSTNTSNKSTKPSNSESTAFSLINPSSSSLLPSSSSSLQPQALVRQYEVAVKLPEKSSESKNKSVTFSKNESSALPNSSLKSNVGDSVNNKSEIQSWATFSDLILKQDRLLTRVPIMNSMVGDQLRKLLKVREALVKKFLHTRKFRYKPVAVLTAYSVKKIPTNGSDLTGSSKKVFFGKFLPITCEHVSAVIHLEKFHCPGTYRPCVEFNGTIISPLDFLKTVGYQFTEQWDSVFRTKDGKTIRMLFDSGRLDFRRHRKFCSGQCHSHSSNSAQSELSIQSLLSPASN